MCAKTRIADRGPSLFGVEAAGEQGIGFEAGRAAAELARMGQNHASAAVHGLDDATDLDIEVAIFAEFADVVAVFPGADDGEAAVVVGGLGRADVEETSAVGKLHHVIDMRRNTNVFVEHFGGLVGGDAGPGGGVGGETGGQANENETVRRAQGHDGHFPGNGRMLARFAEGGKVTQGQGA